MSGLTVGELRRVFERLPDDMPVRVEVGHRLPEPGKIPEGVRANLMEVAMTQRMGKSLRLYIAEPLDP